MSEWIECSVSLPEVSVPVWAVENGSPFLAALVKSECDDGSCTVWARVYGEPYYVIGEGWHAPSIEMDDEYMPNYWMPLPELPK